MTQDDLGRAWVILKSAKNDFSGNFTENAPRMTQIVPGSLRNVRKMTFQIILAEMLLGWPSENAPRMTHVVPGSLRNVRKMTFQIILAEMLLGWPRSCLGRPEKCKKRLFSKFYLKCC
ncbi:hypothetical protein T11_668 [Trichinella zimbabwensis]|uniref:Uncharacterized protein n=1 Tax=Trichinella zimbabwensis TaxID=268475 RepID=A0A0V1GMZ1_9BILA|nr:hypothetical protein T11_668 [Trichinella zimbabwensis]